ncbi:hypothetical protein KHA80_06125 [Anaerobacillus sp. HL2]|nr:hypothetical protein KHA80_06125 [Anaerobacillus sp. HL2]
MKTNIILFNGEIYNYIELRKQLVNEGHNLKQRYGSYLSALCPKRGECVNDL